jgi:hypothetical protein
LADEAFIITDAFIMKGYKYIQVVHNSQMQRRKAGKCTFAKKRHLAASFELRIECKLRKLTAIAATEVANSADR